MGSIGALALGVGTGLCFRAMRIDWLGWAALASLCVSMLLALIYHVSYLIPGVVKLKNLEREASRVVIEDFNADMDLIHHLSTSFEARHLSYAGTQYARMARHMRERIGLLVGALDKVGILPVAATAYLTYSQAVQDGISFGLYGWIALAFVGLYIIAIRASATAQWMEQVSEIYVHALAVQSGRA